MSNLAIEQRIYAPAFFTEQGLFARFGISPRTAQRWRTTGDGPPFIRVGKRRILYREVDVLNWMSQRTFASRAAELAQRHVSGTVSFNRFGPAS